MGDGMLQDILEIERQIEATLAAEREKAKAWLAEQKNDIDRLADLELEQKAIAADEDGENRCQSTRETGAARICEMRNHVRRLQAIPDVRLREKIARHLSQLTGGVSHDHPDGQN